MNSVGATIVLMAAACFASKTCEYYFRLYDFYSTYMCIIEEHLKEGKCPNIFEPFAVDFEYKGNTYMLLVYTGKISNVPDAYVGKTDWCGNRSAINISSTKYVKNLEYYFKAYLKTTYGRKCESIECGITASNKLISIKSYSELVKNYKGCGLYTYPALNYTYVLNSFVFNDLGRWEISACCPGYCRPLERKIAQVVKDVALVLQRNILIDTVSACMPKILPKVEIADYFTENCFLLGSNKHSCMT